MHPTCIPKKSHLLHWTKQGHETYTGGERVQVYEFDVILTVHRR